MVIDKKAGKEGEKSSCRKSEAQKEGWEKRPVFEHMKKVENQYTRSMDGTHPLLWLWCCLLFFANRFVWWLLVALLCHVHRCENSWTEHQRLKITNSTVFLSDTPLVVSRWICECVSLKKAKGIENSVVNFSWLTALCVERKKERRISEKEVNDACTYWVEWDDWQAYDTTFRLMALWWFHSPKSWLSSLTRLHILLFFTRSSRWAAKVQNLSCIYTLTLPFLPSLVSLFFFTSFDWHPVMILYW